MKLALLLFIFISSSNADEINFGRELRVLNRGKSIKKNIHHKSIDLNWLKTIVSAGHLRFVVKAEIYPEDPDVLVLTSRKGGVTLLNISKPEFPQLIQHWGKGGLDVEGQDRRGNLLVVIGRKGFLYLFRVLPNKKIKLINKMEIPGIGKFKGTLVP